MTYRTYVQAYQVFRLEGGGGNIRHPQREVHREQSRIFSGKQADFGSKYTAAVLVVYRTWRFTATPNSSS